MRWSLKAKLIVSFIIMSMALFGIGFLGTFSLTKIKSVYQSVVHGNVNKLKLVGALTGYAKDSVLPILQLPIVQKYPDKLADFSSDFSSAAQKYSETSKMISDLEKEPGEKEILDRVEEKWKKYSALSQEALSKMKAAQSDKDFEAANIFVNDEVDVVRLELYEELARLSAFQADAATAKDEMASADSKKLQLISLGSVIFGALLAIAYGLWFSKRISTQLYILKEKIAEEAKSIQESSLAVHESITKFSERIKMQSSSVQETMVACDEVCSMVEKNQEGSKQSESKVTDSKKTVEDGVNTVSQLTHAIDDMVASFESIKTEVDASQNSVAEVTQLISQIQTKTNVINEIVFQTKLLSFNASVEAARAGDAGKGFSVVAEEVGGLAVMSGHAASEINQLINQSSKRIIEIFKDMQSRISNQIAAGESKVALGKESTAECERIFESISVSMNEIHQQVQGVTVASTEQTTGVGQITEAIASIDKASQENTSLSQNMEEVVTSFYETASRLNQAVSSLDMIVTGSEPATVRDAA